MSKHGKQQLANRAANQRAMQVLAGFLTIVSGFLSACGVIGKSAIGVSIFALLTVICGRWFIHCRHKLSDNNADKLMEREAGLKSDPSQLGAEAACYEGVSKNHNRNLLVGDIIISLLVCIPLALVLWLTATKNPAFKLFDGDDVVVYFDFYFHGSAPGDFIFACLVGPVAQLFYFIFGENAPFLTEMLMTLSGLLLLLSVPAAVWLWKQKGRISAIGIVMTSMFFGSYSLVKSFSWETALATGAGGLIAGLVVVIGLVVLASGSKAQRDGTATGGVSVGGLTAIAGGLALMKDHEKNQRSSQMRSLQTEIRRCRSMGQNRSAEILSDKLDRIKASGE